MKYFFSDKMEFLRELNNGINAPKTEDDYRKLVSVLTGILKNANQALAAAKSCESECNRQGLKLKGISEARRNLEEFCKEVDYSIVDAKEELRFF